MISAALLVGVLAPRSNRSGKASADTAPPPPVMQAATVESNAEAIRRRVAEGQQVRITDDEGREWRGRIQVLARDTLTLVLKDRQQRDVPYGNIIRIDRPHDSLANGALIGFAAGAGLGLFAVISEENEAPATIHLFPGSPDGVNSTDDSVMQAGPGLNPPDGIGVWDASLAVADFDSDGFGDLVVGAPGNCYRDAGGD